MSSISIENQKMPKTVDFLYFTEYINVLFDKTKVEIHNVNAKNGGYAAEATSTLQPEQTYQITPFSETQNRKGNYLPLRIFYTWQVGLGVSLLPPRSQGSF